MELKAGYKQTEMGLLPQAWSVGEIRELNPFVTSGSRGWAQYYSDRGSAFLRITNLSRGSIYPDLSDLKLVRLPTNATEGSRTQLHDGDLLVSITADIGIIGFIESSVPKPAYINQHIALVRLDPAKADSKFVSYFLASDRAQRVFRATTDQGAKAGMSLAGVLRIKAVLPPLAEQRVVAAALSDVDALLVTLDRLIAKKRDLKQAAMHQLLTGQTRLPGFGRKWETKRLGEMGSFSKGRGLAKDDLVVSGAVPAIPYTAIYTDHAEVIQLSQIRHFINSTKGLELVSTPHLLIASSSNMLENIGKATAFIGDVSVAVGGDILLYKTTADVRFISYLLSTPAHRARVVSLSQGSTIRHVYAATFRNYELVLPSAGEQAAIAAVLVDMDAEIAALEQRRDKTRVLKQGMMQELLTGRTRLV